MKGPHGLADECCAFLGLVLTASIALVGAFTCFACVAIFAAGDPAMLAGAFFV